MHESERLCHPLLPYNSPSEADSCGHEMRRCSRWLPPRRNMEQRVSLICSLKNLDSNNNFKVELIIYSDTQRKASKSAGFTEDKAKDTSNVINFEKFFAMPYFYALFF